jgi:signal peptidase I
MRETIESIVVAFILAFLFRTFEAEAFVIPTGSMAPTLLGRHKDVVCNQCEISFRIGASDEVGKDDGYYHQHRRLKTAVCPNCRRRLEIENLAVFKGDRILVNKFPYEFADPDRWDVVVFKFPEDSRTNYIKRLVGKPGETIKIQRGDVHVRLGDETSDWSIARKENPDKQRQLQILVYDNDHPERELHKHGWPQRWVPVRSAGSSDGIAGWSEESDGWTPDLEGRAFELSRNDDDHTQRWIRYRHIIPTEGDWDEAIHATQEERTAVLEANPRPQLITDFCGYNAYTGGDSPNIDPGYYWVGDLTVTCAVQLEDIGPEASFTVELNEGFRRYQCRLDPQTGDATLLFFDDTLDPRDERVLATAQTNFMGSGTYEISFANVDDRLCLWIDGSLVEFADPAEYHAQDLPSPRDADLLPVGIAAGNMGVRVSHLLLERDIYYRAEHAIDDDDTHRVAWVRNEYQIYTGSSSPRDRQKLAELLSKPEKWSEEYSAYAQPAIFPKLGENEFFVMGDNSPRSADSRLWSNTRGAPRRHAVPRTALVGKAFYVYWPHGIPFLNDGNGFSPDVPPIERFFYHQDRPRHVAEDMYPKRAFPFYPQIGEMRRIR